MAIESAGLLAITDQPLRRVLQSVTGSPPDLVVVSQSIEAPSEASIAVPPLPADLDLLVRRTSYVHRGSVLSRHVSFVVTSALPSRIIVALREARTDLMDVAANEGVRKLDFSFGRAGTDKGVDEAILEGFGADGFPPDFVWRRYLGTIRGAPVFVILEALADPLSAGARRARA